MSGSCGQKLSWEFQCTQKAKEISLWLYWEVENEIIVLLINGRLNRECCHGNKMFYSLELLSSCFISVPSFT